METDKDMWLRLADLLSDRLGGEGLEAERKGDDWQNVRARVDTLHGETFLDFGFGGHDRDDGPLFATNLDGPLRTTSEGDAFAYFMIRIDEQGRARLAVRTMAADWHRGKKTDPRNVGARIHLARQLARAKLTFPWKAAPPSRIDNTTLRSAMVWLWREWQPITTLDALADRIAADVRAARPLLIEAVGKD